MKNCILLALIASAITGCGKVSKVNANITGYDKVCIGGVSYIQFTSGASPEYTRDGKIKSCD